MNIKAHGHSYENCKLMHITDNNQTKWDVIYDLRDICLVTRTISLTKYKSGVYIKNKSEIITDISIYEKEFPNEFFNYKLNVIGQWVPNDAPDDPGVLIIKVISPITYEYDDNMVDERTFVIDEENRKWYIKYQIDDTLLIHTEINGCIEHAICRKKDMKIEVGADLYIPYIFRVDKNSGEWILDESEIDEITFQYDK